MRYLLGIIALLASFTATAADATRQHAAKGQQITVRLSIANPCLNSQYLHLNSCSGQLTQRVVETTQQMPLHSKTGEVLSESPESFYLVRTTDYY